MSIENTTGVSIYNVRQYGATGNKEDNAQGAIQQAINAANAAGGGVVYFPPGAYTSGTIHLLSHVRVYIEAGATLYSSKDPSTFDQKALFYGEDVQNITLEGRGEVNGQAEYEWRLSDIRDWYIYPNQVRWENAGLPLMRSFPTPNSIGNLVLLVRCTDVVIRDLSFIDSPSWTMHPWGCERLVIDGVYINTSLKYGVWADGIDPDGCKDVRISNCTIQTGDDALVFYSSAIFGPARPCENITVTNCRLTSASSALKFCDGNLNAIRNVVIDNCVITDSNRGIAFMVFDGGIVENVVISNITIDCKRFDWYWWGDGDPLHFNLIRRSEIDSNIDKTTEPAIGKMRNILLRNIFARGIGACLIHGSPDSLLDNVAFENVRLEIASDADSPLQKSETALTIENANRVRLKDFEIAWENPVASAFQRTLKVNNVHGLTIDSLTAPAVPNGSTETPVIFNQVDGLEIRNGKV
jgi:hypothetical protein